MIVELGPGAWVVLLGWPALLAGAGLFGLGCARESRWVASVGCLLMAPTFLYLGLTPRFQWLALPALALVCVAAWRVERLGRPVLVLLVLPAVLLVAWLVLALLG